MCLEEALIELEGEYIHHATPITVKVWFVRLEAEVAASEHTVYLLRQCACTVNMPRPTTPLQGSPFALYRQSTQKLKTLRTPAWLLQGLVLLLCCRSSGSVVRPSD